MNLRIGKLIGLGAALVLLALAAGSSGQTGLSQEEFWTIDDTFAMWAHMVPGFGGLFFDEHGNLNVYLVDLRYANYAKEFFQFFLPTEEWGISISGEIVILQGQYDFIHLSEWMVRATDVLTLEGVEFLDIDDSRNRLLVAVVDPCVTAEVEHMLHYLGIPSEAVIVEVVPPSQKSKERFGTVSAPLQVGCKLRERAFAL